MSRTTISRAIRGALLALALTSIVVGTAFATGASGFHGTPLARGTMSESVQFNTGEVKFQTKAAVDFAMATVTIDPLGSSGWHEHPGVVLVTVKAGTVTFYDQNCTPTTHATGTSFVEAAGDGPGLARNESATDPAIVYVTYIVPADAALRIDTLLNPGCPQN